MTEFKQIIGRGTRLLGKEGKNHFGVLDFCNVKKCDFLSKYSGVAREVLEALLDKYMNTGIYEIEKTEILQLEPFKKFGKPSKIATYFGGKAGYIQAVRALEEELYKAG